jgi:predicted TIM-barrel fold metal-dependent hydrolase
MTAKARFLSARCNCCTTADFQASPINRRAFLSGSAALAAFGGIRNAGAQATNPRRIDVHHHLSSPGFIREISARKTGQKPLEDWTPAQSIEEMDKSGVATAITSISEPSVYFGDNTAARVLARECNEYGAKIKGDFRGRFGSFAILPMPDVDGSLKEIDYALGTLKAEGICMMTSYQSKYLGDPAFAPIMDELDRRRAVIFIHPARGDCCRNLVPNVIEPVIEMPEDTARTMLSLVFSGTVRRCPNLKFIFSHAGGSLPALIHRVEWWANLRKDFADRYPDGVTAEFKKFYYDTAFSAFPSALAPLKNLVPTTQILFGTDFPLFSSAATAKGIADFGFSAAELAAIDRNNVVRLIPSLA